MIPEATSIRTWKFETWKKTKLGPNKLKEQQNKIKKKPGE